MSHPTSTAQWSLVIHRVSPTTAEVWVGTLFPNLKMPDRARVLLFQDKVRSAVVRITKDQWRRPFEDLDQRFYRLVTFQNLDPWTDYQVRFDRQVNPLAAFPQELEIQVTDAEVTQDVHWQPLKFGSFRTLPLRVPEKGRCLSGRDTFTIGLGSCFYNHKDGGQAAEAYKRLYTLGDPDERPDVTFLTGDQVYLDIGFDSLSLIPDEIWERVAEDYAVHWQALGSILSRGGTWMLPDDHEYWNDYPFYDSPIPLLWALKLDHVRKAWEGAAKDGVMRVQRSPIVEQIDLQDVSICLADFRSFRSEEGIAVLFEEVLEWGRSLECPGILSICQPLIVNENSVEKNLRSYREQYGALLSALAHSGHDIVILSGDVHYGRISEVPLGQNGGRLIEIISSPLSNLTGLNGIATGTAKTEPPLFPDYQTAQDLGWLEMEVDYHRPTTWSSGKKWLDWIRSFFGLPRILREAGKYCVKPYALDWLGGYPADRTAEHFMTVGLSRLSEGKGVELTANAWLVRERDGSLPARSFKEPYRTVLK